MMKFKFPVLVVCLVASLPGLIAYSAETTKDDLLEKALGEAMKENPGLAAGITRSIDEKIKQAGIPQSDSSSVPNSAPPKSLNFPSPTQSGPESTEAAAKVIEKSKKKKKERQQLEEMKIADEESAAQERVRQSDEEQARIKRKEIYVPSPVDAEDKHPGFYLERDSGRVLTTRMSPWDSVTVKMCFSSGLSIVLDSDIETDLQRIIIDDKIYFDAQEFDNHRGVYVRMKQPVEEGKHWESSVRLVRRADDKAYLINLIAVACPSSGTIPFPKVLYVRDKWTALTDTTKVMTPEDTIISTSKGLPRLSKHGVNIYDMVASSGSEWVVFGIEVLLGEGTKFDASKPMEFKVLDNLQVSEIQTKSEYLPAHSAKATEIRGQTALRYRVLVNIGKKYILDRRYIHLMLLDPQNGHYQYVRVDTLPYLASLRKRGFEL